MKVETSEHGFKYTKLDSGRIVWFRDAIREAEAGCRKVERWLYRAAELVGGEYGDLDEEEIEWFLDHLEVVLKAHREAAEKRTGKRTFEARIALLRNTTGRTPEEAETFRRKADELERRMEVTDE